MTGNCNLKCELKNEWYTFNLQLKKIYSIIQNK